MSSPPIFSGVWVTRSLVLCVCFVDRCLSFYPFSLGHCFVCSSSIYGLWITWGELRCSRRISISCTTSGTRRVTLATNSLISHEWRRDRIVIKTNVNCPFIYRNNPAAPAYGIYIYQLIRYSKACGSYQNFFDRVLLLTRKLLNHWTKGSY
jgi:hypothetical protein